MFVGTSMVCLRFSIMAWPRVSFPEIYRKAIFAGNRALQLLDRLVDYEPDRSERDRDRVGFAK